MLDVDVKRSVVNDYLVGGSSYRQLSKKYGISHNTVYRWIAEHQQQEETAANETEQLSILQAMNQEAKQTADLSAATTSPAAQIAELKKELAQEKLHNKLLTTMIDIAEDQLKIPIRKKYGTRQSAK